MKKFIYLTIVIIFGSCASAKLGVIPLGQWDYTVTGTPNGNYAGVLTVTLDGEKYAAALKSQAGEIRFNETQYDKKLKKLTGNFDFQGTLIYFESTTEGDMMKGSVSAEGSSWPFNATRKK